MSVIYLKKGFYDVCDDDFIVHQINLTTRFRPYLNTLLISFPEQKMSYSELL